MRLRYERQSVTTISSRTHAKCKWRSPAEYEQAPVKHSWVAHMPTALRHGRWRFFFYSNEGSEPPHVHVESGEGTAKLWLTPVALVGSTSIKSAETRDIERFVRQNRTLLLEAWNEHFGR